MDYRTRIGLVAVAVTLAACTSPTAPSSTNASRVTHRPPPAPQALCTGGGGVGSGDHC
jgi:hypothetical protein